MASITLSPTNAFDLGDGSLSWNNPTNVLTDDSNYAEIVQGTGVSNTLVVEFSPNLPANAVIRGLEVRIKRATSNTKGVTRFESIFLGTNNTPLSLDKSPDTDWSQNTTIVEDVFGSPTDTWGYDWSVSEVNNIQLFIQTYNDNNQELPRIYYASLTVYYDLLTAHDTKVEVINRTSGIQDTKVEVGNITSVIQDTAVNVSNTLQILHDTKAEVINQASKSVDSKVSIYTASSSTFDTALNILKNESTYADTRAEIGNILTAIFDTKTIVSSTFFDTAVRITNILQKSVDTAIEISRRDPRIFDSKAIVKTSSQVSQDTALQVIYLTRADTKLIVSLRKQKIIDTLTNVGFFDLSKTYLFQISGKINVNANTVSFLAPHFAVVVGDFSEVRIAETGERFTARKNFLGQSKVFLLLGHLLNQQVTLYSFGGNIEVVYLLGYFVQVNISSPLNPEIVQNVKRLSVNNKTLLVRKGKDFVRTKLDLSWTNPEETLQITDFLNKFGEFAVYIPNLDVFIARRISSVSLDIPYTGLYRISFEVEEVK